MADKDKKYNVLDASRLSVAPMMDWTDRHCRYLHRLLSRQALLYTEMVTAPALVRGGALHLLEFDAGRTSGRAATWRLGSERTGEGRADWGAAGL